MVSSFGILILTMRLNSNPLPSANKNQKDVKMSLLWSFVEWPAVYVTVAEVEDVKDKQNPVKVLCNSACV